MKTSTQREQELQRQLDALQIRLVEAEETLRAIREGEVDAVVVSGSKGEQIFSLVGTDSIYRLIVETMNEAAFTVTFDGKLLFCNAQFGVFVKRPLEQIVGHPLEEFVAASNKASARALLSDAQKQPVRHRLVFQAADGRAVPAHVSASVLDQPDGLSLCVVANDLTELENSTELIQQLRRQEEALRQSEERLRSAGRAAKVGLFEWNTEKDEAYWSPEHYELLGLAPDSPASFAAWEARVHPDDLDRVRRSMENSIADARNGCHIDPFRDEYRIVRPDGTVAWLETTVAIEFDGRLVMRGAVRDITERKQAEEELRASLREKEVLLKEVHHRVKNNMQVISSLVSLQADAMVMSHSSLETPNDQSPITNDQALRGAFDDLRDQVRTMALVHEKLYQSDNLACVDFAEYARSLLDYLWYAHGDAAAAVRLTLDISPVVFSVEMAVPCGLILNELVTNALKYAFRDRIGGELTVTLTAAPDGQLCLRVRDNGVGFPAEMDWRQTRSLGLQLVQMLTGQLGGTMDVLHNGGTEFKIAFRQRGDKEHEQHNQA